jgi:hypothetical protein
VAALSWAGGGDTAGTDANSGVVGSVPRMILIKGGRVAVVEV